ncbi:MULTISPECIES: diaminopimelate epimerase [unclassified Haladaptatus]|uniref:diaminopimelate epimerase n=1 Tax=unclassified Haladaptatus TaxID=2622732 RepID=UPI0023E8ACDD|nr:MULTISPECIES: diaminopimelate epimerase [unclassified Haladaptatus]
MIRFDKYHGTGNDFVLVDAAEAVPDRRALATELCHRETGVSHPSSDRVGADGVLFLALEDRYSPPRVVMTLVQPDGSTASMCGNGARCAAAWAAERTGASEIMIDTQAGTRHARIEDDGVTIEMGTPLFEPAAVPVLADEPVVEQDFEGYAVTAVNTGVPHAVIFVDDVADVDLDAVAPAIRHAEIFPEGANVNVASQRDDGGFDQRTFERGVEGETRSCGTGAVAIAAAARELGLVSGGSAVSVSPPGGDLEVTLTDGPAFLHGPVELDFRSEVPVSKPRRLDPTEA